MHMANHGATGGPERHVHRAVVERILPPLIKADYDIERAGRRDGGWHGGVVRVVELARHRPGGAGGIPHPTLEEVSSEGRLGELQDPGSARVRRVGRGEKWPETRQILRESSFTGTELGERDGQRQRHITHSS